MRSCGRGGYTANLDDMPKFYRDPAQWPLTRVLRCGNRPRPPFPPRMPEGQP